MGSGCWHRPYMIWLTPKSPKAQDCGPLVVVDACKQEICLVQAPCIAADFDL